MSANRLDTDGSIGGEKSLMAVGQWLRNARKLKGESLEDAANITRIGKNYLEALEEGDVGRLPSLAYTRGFIRLYAAHLGLSPDEAVCMMTGQTADMSTQDQRETLSARTRPLSSSRQAGGSQKIKKILIPAICAVALAALVFFLMNHAPRESSVSENRTGATTPPPSGSMPAAAGTVQLPAKIETPAAATSVPAGNSEVSAEAGIVLRLKAVSNGRLHITIDGSVSQEYDLVSGDMVEWKAEKMFLLDLENAGSVEGELDNTPLKSFGPAGKAAHLIIRQNGVQNN